MSRSTLPRHANSGSQDTSGREALPRFPLPEPRRVPCRRSIVLLLTASLAALANLSCTGNFYKKWADRETYAVLREKQTEVFGKHFPFTIEPGETRRGQYPVRSASDLVDISADRARTPQPTEGDELTAEADKLEMPPLAPEGTVKLSLRDCLEIAMTTSRQYQSEREQLYLSALSLTLDRHEWTPIFSGLVSGTLTRSGAKGNRSTSASGSARPNVAQRILTGATSSVSLTVNASRVVSRHAKWSVDSTLTGNIVQPLLQGLGPRVALENLRQSERDVIYAVRAFRRFQKTFVVGIVTDYFRVLQREDQVENNWVRYDGTRYSTLRLQDMSRAGRRSRLELAQGKVQELEAYNSWTTAVQSYYAQLDGFKVALGLRPDAHVILDRRELERVAERGLEREAVAIDKAVDTAQSKRLDLMTVRDRVDDATRKVYVAKHNAILPHLDLEGSYRVQNASTDQWARFRTPEATYSTGVELDPGLDRKSERNTYRSALITLERRKRDLESQEDSVELQVLRAWRSLREAESSYEIQKVRVPLAREQVESARLLMEAGRSTMRAVLDAEDDLLDATNALTASIVNHVVAQLDLERDMGTLDIDEEGYLRDERIAAAQRP